MRLEQIKQWDVVEYTTTLGETSFVALVIETESHRGRISVISEIANLPSLIPHDQITRVLYNIGDPFKRQENPTELCTLSEALVKLETGEWKEAVDAKGDIIKIREDSKRAYCFRRSNGNYINVDGFGFNGSREWTERKKPEEELKPCFCGKLPELITYSKDGRTFNYYNCDSTIDEGFNHFLKADDAGGEYDARKNWNILMKQIDNCYEK